MKIKAMDKVEEMRSSYDTRSSMDTQKIQILKSRITTHKSYLLSYMDVSLGFSPNANIKAIPVTDRGGP
jgi:hypothetical protein